MGRDNKGQGHGGRGRGRGKSSGRRDTNAKPVEMKFLPHTTGTNKLMATYEMVKTQIEQYVQTYKHGQDIAESLRELQKKDLSGAKLVRQMSTYVKEDEERVRKIEQEGYDVLYTAEVQNYMEKYLGNQPRKSICAYTKHILQWDDATPHRRTSRV